MRPLLSGFCAVHLALSACAELTEPGSGAPERVSEAAPERAPQPEPSAAPAAPPAAPAPSGERVTASHVLISYKGALRAAPTVVRSKQEAQKLARDVLNKAKAGEDFVNLAVKHSDDPSAKTRGGGLGTFGRQQMVKPFSDAAFALKPGELSDVVETDFGFHVIKRTE
jgi:hypothetical protein